MVKTEEAVQVNIQLENEKLREEIAVLKDRGSLKNRVIQLAPAFSVIVGVIGLVWTVIQFSTQQENHQKALESSAKKSHAVAVKAARKARETAEREFMKPWLESQREIYIQTLTAVATIANSQSEETVAKAKDAFWVQYYGPMILVEPPEVVKVMKAIRKCLKTGTKCGSDKLNGYSLALATVLAKSMGETGNMTFDVFSKKQFKYEKSD